MQLSSIKRLVSIKLNLVHPFKYCIYIASNYQNTHSSSCTCCVTKTDISETESGIIDPLVSKRPKKFQYKKHIRKLKKKTIKKLDFFGNALSHHCTLAWVTRPEQGVKNRGAHRLLVYIYIAYIDNYIVYIYTYCIYVYKINLT